MSIPGMGRWDGRKLLPMMGYSLLHQPRRHPSRCSTNWRITPGWSSRWEAVGYSSWKFGNERVENSSGGIVFLWLSSPCVENMVGSRFRYGEINKTTILST